MSQLLIDRLLEQIVVDTSDPAPKLVLADVLEEQGEDRLAGAVRWCAEHGRWPHLGALSSRPGWQWIRLGPWGIAVDWHSAVLPDELIGPMNMNHAWYSPTFHGAMALLANALDRLEAQCPHP